MLFCRWARTVTRGHLQWDSESLSGPPAPPAPSTPARGCDLRNVKVNHHGSLRSVTVNHHGPQPED